MTKKDTKIDTEKLDFAKSIIELLESGGDMNRVDIISSLQYCTRTITDLVNENQSLWFMLDEMHKSDVENYSESLQKAWEQLQLDILMKNMKPSDA